MLVVVNQPHINDFVISGTIDPAFLDSLKKKFGSSLTINEDDYVDIESTDWYKDMKSMETPGDNMRTYRHILKLTQQELALKLGTSKQHVSDMERGNKPISKKTAKELAKIFDTSPARFI